MDIILGAILGAMLVILAICIFSCIKKNERELDYDTDVRYLNVCIEKEIKFYISTEIEPRELQVIGVESFQKMMGVITQRVVICLSKKYIKTLSVYFSQPGLQSYIFQLVLAQVLPYCVNNNAIKERYSAAEKMIS